MKKVIIFGATGNIGAYFTDYCGQMLDSSEYEIIATGRRNTDYYNKKGIEYVNVDLCKPETFDNLPVNEIYAVVNLAGVLPAYLKEYDPFAYVETNINGALRILEYARKNQADRVIYTQTWADQAGYWGKEEVLSPNMPRKLLYTGDHAFYSITKSMIVDTMEYYKQEYGLKNFVFRLPNVYLYHPEKMYYVDGMRKPIGYRYMIDKASKGETIEMWGNPEAFKDILYIKDLCQMMLKALFANVDGGIYNAGTGIKTTLRQQIEGMVEVFSPDGNKSQIIEKPEGAGFTSFVMDIGNARRDLGYEPEYTYLKYLQDYKLEQEQKRFDELWR
jgi:UDP-glucose 4-epimerase